MKPANMLIFTTQTFGNLKVEITQISHVHAQLYTNKGILLASLGHVLCCDWLQRTNFCVA
jgi:hypothetical protein